MHSSSLKSILSIKKCCINLEVQALSSQAFIIMVSYISFRRNRINSDGMRSIHSHSGGKGEICYVKFLKSAFKKRNLMMTHVT